MHFQLTYITLLKQESAYKDSTFYKAEDGKNLKWTFGSSFFFSMNVFTTTGYGMVVAWFGYRYSPTKSILWSGSIAPESTLGKTCVIIYGFIFVPLTLVVIRHLGNWTLIVVTNVYAKGVIRWRWVCFYIEVGSASCILQILYGNGDESLKDEHYKA